MTESTWSKLGEVAADTLTNPLTLLVTLVAIVAWVVLWQRRRTLTTLLRVMESANAEERARLAGEIGFSFDELSSLPPGQRVGLLTHRLMLFAYLSTLIAFLVYQGLLVTAYTSSIVLDLEGELRREEAQNALRKLVSATGKGLDAEGYSLLTTESEFSGVFLVHAPVTAHVELMSTLNALRVALDMPPRALPLYSLSSETADVLRKLEHEATVSFFESPADEIYRVLGEMHDVEIHVDWGALEEIGFSRMEPMTLHADSIRLKTALDMLNAEIIDIGYTVHDGRIFVTSEPNLNYSQRFSTVLAHDVRDLISHHRIAEAQSESQHEVTTNINENKTKSYRRGRTGLSEPTDGRVGAARLPRVGEEPLTGGSQSQPNNQIDDRSRPTADAIDDPFDPFD